MQALDSDEGPVLECLGDRPDGHFVLAYVVVPEDPRDAVTPVDGIYDKPSTLADQLRWLAEAGFAATVTWKSRDLAELV